MAKRIPEFRDLLTLTNASVWKDRRNGVSALILNTLDGVQSAELTSIFKTARAFGLTIDRKRPLIVYGTHCLIGESPTFRFVQMTPKQLAELDEQLFQATYSAA